LRRRYYTPKQEWKDEGIELPGKGMVGDAGIEPTTPGLEDGRFRHGFDLSHMALIAFCSVFMRSSQHHQPLGTTPFYFSDSFRVGTAGGYDCLGRNSPSRSSRRTSREAQCSAFSFAGSVRLQRLWRIG